MWNLQLKNHTIVCVELKQAFGLVLRAERKAANLTQEKLAEFADLSDRHISLLERAERTPNIVTIFKAARGLGIEPSELIEKVRDLNPDIDTD